MENNPLDLEQHEEDTPWDVWKRRVLFFVLMALCAAFAAPTFGSCTGAVGPAGRETLGHFQIGGKRRDVSVREFDSTSRRLALTLAFRGQRRDEDSEQATWRHIMLTEAAKEAGIHASRSEVARILARELPDLVKDGEFDQSLYQVYLDSRTQGQLVAKDATLTFQELFAMARYVSVLQMPLGVGRSAEAYADWKKENPRLTVSYVVQSYDPFTKQVAATEPSDEELRLVAKAAASEYVVPEKKVVESLYVRSHEVTDEQLAAMRAYVEERVLLDFDEEEGFQATLDRECYGLFWADRERSFDKRNWTRMQKPIYEEDLREYDERLKAWEDGGKEGPEPVKPKDPADVVWPSSPETVWETYWKGFTQRELLGGLVIGDLARRAERENLEFSALKETFEPLGVRYAVNEEPLTLEEFEADYPDGLALGSEVMQRLRTELKGPPEGGNFRPAVLSSPFPLVRDLNDARKRGTLTLRLSGYVPARPLTLEEIRADERLIEFYRRWKASTLAHDRLEELRKRDGVDGATFASLAKGAGLEVRQIRAFNRDTPKFAPPIIADDAEPDPELQAIADGIIHRNRVMDLYRELTELEPGQTFGRIVSDDSTEAAYMVLLEAKQEPRPIEMDEGTKRSYEMKHMQDLYMALQDLASFEHLSEKYGLEVDEAARGLPPKQDEDAEKEEARSDGDE